MRLAIIAVIALLAFGCIQPVQKLGCCMKENISQGCVLYNTTDFLSHDFISKTNGPCDSNDTAYNTTGHCNVTVGNSTYLIPICTQDQLVKCVNQNCTAMVCGDYAFKPRFAPGFSTTGNDTENADSSVESSAGNIPPDTGEGGAANFYKAQCRFFTMDAKLRQIMKSSQASINVFRIGIGGSFDEYDQYRYFMPLSDRYCSNNPPLMGQSRVDRYMNYLASDKTAYEPEADITQNCLRDDVSSPFGTPNPFGFAESAAAKSSYVIGAGAFSYAPVVPDLSNYKFAHTARVVMPGYWQPEGYYRYTGATVRQDSVFKKIDEAFYKRELSIAHADTIYGNTAALTTRAPFECDSAGNDCYSSACDTRVYNRGVLVTWPDGLNGGDEVVSDCNKVSDEAGNTLVVCAPTISVASAGAGNPPARTFATVDVFPQHFQIAQSYDYPLEQSELTEEGVADAYWAMFNQAGIRHSLVHGSERTVTNNVYVSYYITAKKNCKFDYGENDEDTSVLCPSVYDSVYGPPVGGAVFFGKLGDTEITYNGDTIIGYAIASDQDFKSMLLVDRCQLKDGVDYVKVELGRPEDASWNDLMSAFLPMYQQRVSSVASRGFDDGCGEEMQTMDLMLSSMPWIVNYQKGLYDQAFIGSDTLTPISTHLSSAPAQFYRNRNTYAEYMNPATGTSSCDLRRTVVYWWWQDRNYYYNIAYTRYFYLFKYEENSGHIGICSVDESDLLPSVRTYGWCTPCTTSTLAYQKISAYDRVYLPALSANVDSTWYSDLQGICSPEYKTEWEGWTGFQTTDNVSCYNPYITDINEYKDSIASIGSPRTSPEASIIKERIGNYMKSGVMPIFDMTDASNWVVTNPDSSADGFFLFYTDAPDTYQQYDFQRLFGNMGASVVIVDHVSGEADNAKVENIVARSGIIKERCFGCLTAFHVDSPSSNTSFNQSVNSVLSDPRAQFSIDMVTFDYPISDHSSVFSGITDAKNRSEAITLDIASYGRAALLSRRVPSMVVGLNVKSNDGYWNDNNYKTLFETIVLEQDKLVNAGVTGIVYSPARDAAGGKGIVQTSGSVGSKTAKFCAVEGAMQKMSLGEPVALFSRANSVKSVNCTKCSSLDKLGTGVCSDYTISQGKDPKMCDNGVLCTEPGEAEEHTYTCSCDGGIDSVCQVCDEENTCVYVGETCPDLTESTAPSITYRCPEETVVEECQLCNETGGTVTCTLSHTNGTKETIGPMDMSEVGSDLYMDIIAGLPKGEKCCLKSQNQTYTYVKDTFQNSVNKPVVFPRTGDPNVDCGMGDPGILDKLGSFCGIDIPLRNYDINCSLSG